MHERENYIDYTWNYINYYGNYIDNTLVEIFSLNLKNFKNFYREIFWEDNIFIFYFLIHRDINILLVIVFESNIVDFVIEIMRSNFENYIKIILSTIYLRQTDSFTVWI